MGLLDGKVAIITGAGRGIGRAYALLFAQEGASIVVNDLGGGTDGSGADTGPAEQVAQEIRDAGGKAVANTANVTNADQVEAMVKQAVDTFGRLDILVNNAGILRDKTLLKMTDDLYDIVVAVHQKGTYLCSKFAAQAMKDLGNGGRIISTTSYAGLQGNYGQTNYSAAKAGVWGFTLTAAQELSKVGITCNCIAPMAKTRMTEDINLIPEDFRPEDASPMVLFLASDLAQDVTGRTFGVHGRQVFEYVMEMTKGVEKSEGAWTASEIAEQLPEIAKTRADRARELAAAAPAGGGKTDQEVIFEHLHEAFVPDKAGDWKAGIFFDVAGGKPYTLVVQDGTCTVEPGKSDLVTCTVNIDIDTVVGMLSGSVDPTKAFMAGKIKADNLTDMMRFSKVFDLMGFAPRAQELAAGNAGGADGDSGSTKDPQEEAFENMNLAFVEEKAANWKAGIYFAVDGGTDYTLQVADGQLNIAKGKADPVTCNVTVDRDTILGMIEGTVDPTKAFMAGKVKADNLQDMMKFGQVFDFKRYREAAEKAGKVPGGDESNGTAKAANRTPTGINRDIIGKTYNADAVFAKPIHIAEYAAATNDDNPRYEAKADGTQQVPPVFSVAPLKEIMFSTIGDPETGINFLRMVHGEQEFIFHEHLKPWDLINPRAEWVHVEEKDSGDLATVRMRAMVDGNCKVEALGTFFVRGEKKSGKSEKPVEPTHDILHEESMEVTDDQSLRYAKASGDDNPIHTDPETAKQAGLPGIILQGLCTMAFSTKAVVDHTCGGDPERLKRVRVRFSKPVLPGDTVTTRIWKAEASNGHAAYGFEAVNQDGARVITNGYAEVL